MNNEINIKPLTSGEIEKFFIYLKDHISDNGKDGADLFLPISRNDLNFSNKLINNFRDGLAVATDKPGWRRVLVAVNERDEIIGHIDLKAHDQNYTSHRAIMGMGIDRNYRNMGLGSLLIQSIAEWAKKETDIERIDLSVLAKNNPAIGLYEKLGFQKIGEIEDMFRIDGNSLNYIIMAKKIV